MEIAIIAGEASGDLHGALLAAELRDRDPGVRLWGFGGDAMRAAGVEIVRGIDELAVLGFAEVVGRIPFFLRLEAELRGLLARRAPSALVLIDYPGFNLRVARAGRALGIRVAYYVSPQVWAWGAERVRTVRDTVDRLIVILPFEVAFYAERGVTAEFVGHPLLDVARPIREPGALRAALGVPEGVPLVGLLPGSRVQEVRRHLPLFLEAIRLLEVGMTASGARDERGPDTRVAGRRDSRVAVAIARASTIPEPLLTDLIGDRPVRVTTEAYDLMAAADVLLVASGTATLEAACIGTPMVVVYKTSPLSFLLGRLLVRVPHIALANLVAGRRVVPELVQGDATPEAIAREARALLADDAGRAATRAAFAEVRARLGAPGAAGRAAAIVLALARGEGRA